MWNRSDEKAKSIDDEFAENERRNIVIGIIGTIVIIVLQVLLCSWLGVKPHWGPLYN